jgi:hypothetical protein
MPWSNQGGGPWGTGGGGKGPWGSGPQQSGPTPPDLEEFLRRSQDKLRSVLPGNLGGKGLGLIVLAAIAIWGLSGFFRVDPDELGVVLRFGKYVRDAKPGLNYHLPYPVESVLTPKVTRVNRIDIGMRLVEDLRRGTTMGDVPEESLMLTGDEFEALIGFRLSIVRRAADMLVLHFGDIRAHASGEGTVGAFALHVQCAWRFDGPTGTITGRDDLWEYAGPGGRPPNWSYEDGLSLQDQSFAKFFDRDESTRSWVNESDLFTVIGAEQTKYGDIRLDLSNGYAILLFPANSRYEAWRLFVPESDDDHLVFPT